MNRCGQLGFGKLNLAVALIVNISLFTPHYKAFAQNLLNEGSNSEVKPPKFQNLTSPPKKTPHSAIVSQVPNPITPIPPVPSPQPIPTPQPSPQTPLDITPSPPPSPPPESGSGIPEKITVKKFEFEGNKKKVFSDKELRKITDEFTNKPITFAQLLEVESRITQLYTDAGYLNSAAVIAVDEKGLPREAAVIKVQIIEGGVEEIKVTGTRRLNPEYIRSRIALATSKPLNRFRLLEALQLLQLNPLIKNISAELSAGSRPDQNLVEVKIVEADSFRTELFVDNGRAPSVGSFRRGIIISEGNVFGLGDRFGATYTNTDGSNALDLTYNLPLNARNTTLNLAGGFTDTTVVEPPFDRIDITGDSFYIDVGMRQPIIQSPTQEFVLGLTFSRQESKTKLGGEGYQISPGADRNGETRISALRFIQEYTQRNSQQIFGFRSQFSLGVGFFDATTNGSAPDSRFFSWRGQGQYIRQLARDTLLVLRSDIQLATRPLVPLEQISVGGIQSVRGYRQDEFLVDNGFFASAEVRLPILRAEEVKGVLQLIPFIDFGIGWNNSSKRRQNPDLDPNTLIGVGLGLQWKMGDTFNARIDYGIPLTDVNSRDRTLQEQGFYFSVNYSPF